MNTRAALVGVVLAACSIAGLAQQKPTPPPAPDVTRPPENNDQALRPLGPEEIYPNLSFYAMDPLYKPGVPLGWSTTRITEKLNRGLVVSALDGGRVYLSWRLLQSDPDERRVQRVSRDGWRRAGETQRPADPTHDRLRRPAGVRRSRTHLVGDTDRERTRAGAVRTGHARGATGAAAVSCAETAR